MGLSGPDDLAAIIADEGIRDARLIDAARAVPREDFVPPDAAHRAYMDVPVPIPHGQTTTQPSLIARMIEALELAAQDTVLEVGTGYGYQTALLARLADSVYSVERWADLADTARSNLQRHTVDNATVVHGDGTEGLVGAAPFDAIIVAAAFPDVPAPLVEQLREGGRIVQPIGAGGGEDVVLFVKADRRIQRVRSLTPARFVSGVTGAAE